jgi:epoxyqueuosine reductase
MSNRVLTEEIRAEALSMGMDLVGFGPVERWKNAPYLLSPPAILPEAKTVVVCGFHITDTWTEMGGEPEPQDHSPGGWMDQNSLLDRVAYRLARRLHDRGQQAIAVASSNIWRYRQYEGIPSIFAPDLSHMHAAAAAGLAEIGWSGLAITPEFGPRVRFISIVTDAELTPTPMYNGPKLCDMCGECIHHCPSGAMFKDLNSAKPHVVEIGGRTFKYANKNIWRCAWAEHFNLNLRSDTLTKDLHVDEKVILSELHSRGVRGHERGVCQKVCIPPHLRTMKPSFGRDRRIAQNRINPRYPASMPTLRKLRDDLIADAVAMGADLAAVAPIQSGSAAADLAAREAPGVRTVLALAIQVPPEFTARRDLPQRAGEAYDIAHQKMHHILLRMARKIEDCGYCAASHTDSETAAALAAMTDLGKIEGGAFRTAEFGRDQIVGAITTDAPLDATAQSDGAAMPPRLHPKLTGPALRRRLENLAERNMVTLFGVAPAERLVPVAAQLRGVVDEKTLGEAIIDYNKGLTFHGAFIPKVVRENIAIRDPGDYVSGAKSVVVLGMHYPEDVVGNAGLEQSRQVGCYNFHQYQTTNELRFAALALATELTRMGYRSMIVENLLGVGSYTDSPRGKLADMRCGALEAVAAGLGEIGTSGALLTPAYGPRQRVLCLVTDAELNADAPFAPAGVCKRCAACVEACPMGALGGKSVPLDVGGVTVTYPLVPRHRCDWSKRYSLCSREGPALIGSTTNVVAPAGDVTIEQVAEACKAKDPVMKTRTCILEACLKRCPAGPAVARAG